jgi:hypothetical protein
MSVVGPLRRFVRGPESEAQLAKMADRRQQVSVAALWPNARVLGQNAP